MKILKIFITVIAFVLFAIRINAQTTTFNNDWTYGKEIKARLASIELQPVNSRAYVTIEIQPIVKMKRLNVWYGTSYGADPMLKISQWMTLLGAEYGGSIHSISPNARLGWDKPVIGQTYRIKLVFSGEIMPGANKATLEGEGIYTFKDIIINNPMIYTTSLNSESSIKNNIDNSRDPLCGIYEEVGGQNLKLALVKVNNDYKLVFLSWKLFQVTYDYVWKVGNVAANNIRPTAAGIGKCDWLVPNQRDSQDAYIGFDNGKMTIVINGYEHTYLKTYPLTTPSTNGGSTPNGDSWSGTGFALKDGYVSTNFHVVDGASEIQIYGVGGNFGIGYKAKVVATDKANDLALIKIYDNRFTGFGAIPYSVKTSLDEVGEDIFVLGYPMTSTMGEEIKLTTGVISSQTGFQGDVALYQISAPIQPGNSGGPLFDSRGNIIGVVNAKHSGAENVGYAIKTSYLRNLIESTTSLNILPQNNTIGASSLSVKVKSVKNFVFMIKCYN